MILTELLQSVVPYRHDEDEETYEFDIDGIHYQVRFTGMGVTDIDDFFSSWFDSGTWKISPEEEKKLTQKLRRGAYVVGFDFSARLPGEQRPTIKKTGTGNAYKVLGTVTKILRDFRRLHADPIMITASKSEPSRVKLYSRMIGNRPSVSFETNTDYVWII